MAGIITSVHSPRLVNLCVFNPSGFTAARTSIVLRQPEDAKPTAGSYCEWMPYQVGQAQKTEALQREAAAN